MFLLIIAFSPDTINIAVEITGSNDTYPGKKDVESIMKHDNKIPKIPNIDKKSAKILLIFILFLNSGNAIIHPIINSHILVKGR
ncbi:hypothetical protein SedNR2807_13490 [Citrobacter sedlakii]